MITDLHLNWCAMELALKPSKEDALAAAREMERFHYFASRGSPEERCTAAHVATVLLAIEDIGLTAAANGAVP